MAIIAGEIIFRLSGGASNTDVNLSLGGAKSSTAITTNVAQNLFDHVTGTESASGDTEYRCLYYHNGNASLTATTAKVYITSNTTATGDDLAIGVGSAAINGTEQTIANESTAPTGGVAFTAPADYASGLALGDIPFGQHKAIWVRRVVNLGAAAKTDNVATIEVGVDTLE